MSDITLLHLALGRHAGLVTLWGPNCVQLGRDASGYSVDRLSSALRGEIAPVGRADGSPPIETLVPGQAEGPLAGGTTTLLAASLGTPYELETEGRVLLLEDVHVEPYEVDRCLTQLLHAGKLDVAAGFAIAEHSDVRTKDSFGGHTLELAEVFEDILVPLGRPTVYGLPLGHSPRIATVPSGPTWRSTPTPACSPFNHPAGGAPGLARHLLPGRREIPRSNRKPRPSVAGSQMPVIQWTTSIAISEPIRPDAAPSVAATGAWRCRCSTSSSQRPKSRRMAPLLALEAGAAAGHEGGPYADHGRELAGRRCEVRRARGMPRSPSARSRAAGSRPCRPTKSASRAAARNVARARDPRARGYDLDARVEAAERLRGRVDLEPADIGGPVEDLPVEVAELDRVVVHEHDPADSGAGEPRPSRSPRPPAPSTTTVARPSATCISAADRSPAPGHAK